MAIHINLLAEAQALEEMRRRDPVKRAIWVGASLVAILLVWSGYLQSKAMVTRSELSRLENQLRSNTNEYQQVLLQKKKLDEANIKLDKLHQLATNRFLVGTMLDALQHTIIDEVQLVKIKTENNYAVVAELKAKTNTDGVVLNKGKPAMSTEKIIITIDAKDSSDGEKAIKYKAEIGQSPYFQSMLGKTNEVRLVNLLNTQIGTDGKKGAQFTLECKLPEKTR